MKRAIRSVFSCAVADFVVTGVGPGFNTDASLNNKREAVEIVLRKTIKENSGRQCEYLAPGFSKKQTLQLEHTSLEARVG